MGDEALFPAAICYPYSAAHRPHCIRFPAFSHLVTLYLSYYISPLPP